MIRFEAGDYAGPKDALAIYGEAARRAALTAPARTVRYRLYVMTPNGVRIGTVPFYDGRVDASMDASVQRSFACGLRAEDAQDLDYASARLQPAMQLRMPDGGWCEWPLGVFLPVTPGRNSAASGKRYHTVEAYDQAVILRDDKLTGALTIPGPTKYLDAAYAQLQAAGLSRLMQDDLGASVAEEIQFGIGTSRLDVINALLQAINYRPVWFDEYGYARFMRYTPAYARGVNHSYAAGRASVVTPDVSARLDAFDVPNVIVCVASKAEGALIARWENGDTASALSVPRRGRKVVRKVDVSDIADQATLDEYARRLGNQMTSVADEVRFETLAMPGHGAWDVLSLDIPEAQGRYEEVGWSMELVSGGKMRHTARKVVLI